MILYCVYFYVLWLKYFHQYCALNWTLWRYEQLPPLPPPPPPPPPPPLPLPLPPSPPPPPTPPDFIIIIIAHHPFAYILTFIAKFPLRIPHPHRSNLFRRFYLFVSYSPLSSSFLILLLFLLLFFLYAFYLFIITSFAVSSLLSSSTSVIVVLLPFFFHWNIITIPTGSFIFISTPKPPSPYSPYFIDRFKNLLE